MKRRILIGLVLFAALFLALTGAEAACLHPSFKYTKTGDTKTHKKTCTICGQEFLEEHWEFCDEQDGKCDGCGQTGVISSIQHRKEVYGTSTTHHWKECAICRAALTEPEFHTVVGGKCTICEATDAYQFVTELKLTNETLLLEIGTGAQPTGTTEPVVKPTNANNQTLTYLSSDTKVAIVDMVTGLITGISKGTATITVQTTDGSNLTATCEVTVTDKVVSEIVVMPEKHNLAENATMQLVALVSPQDALELGVEWFSSNEAVATVNENGLVTAVNPGECVITALAKDGGGAFGESKITVINTKVTSIELNALKKTLYLMDNQLVTFQLLPKVYFADKEQHDYTLAYTSTEPTIAAVSETGMITALAPGKATIYVRATDGSDVTATCAVTVKKRPVTGISLSETALELEMTSYGGTSAQLLWTVAPANATNTKVEFTSSDETVATVDEYGLVSAVKNDGPWPQSCVITCRALDGSEKKATCAVTVDYRKIKKITLPSEEVTLNLAYGTVATMQLYPVITPTDAGNPSLTYSTSNKKVATVSKNGLITGMGVGECDITVSAADGSGATAVCKVTVKAYGFIDSITLNTKKLTLSMTSKNPWPTFQAVATVKPEDSFPTLEWESTNELVATVTQTGFISAVAPGKCTVKVTDDTGSVSASIKVTVKKKKVNTVKITYDTKKFNGSVLELDPKKVVSVQLEAKVTPTTAYDRSVIWESSDTDVLTVTNTGLITAISPGWVDLVCRSTDGGASQRLRIHVTDKLVSKITLNAPAKKNGVPTMTLLPTRATTFQMRATVTPTNAADKSVKWSSSDEDIAIVDENTGLVTAIAPGTVIIRATANDESGVTASCTIKVVIVPIKKISLTVKPPIKLVIGKTETYQLKPTITPANASIRTLKYTSSNKKVATVDKNGLITAISTGSCTITLKATDGSGIKTTIQVTVTYK